MENTIIFDKRTQLECLENCRNLFRSLHQKHNVQFDEEDSFRESAEKFMDVLDTKFPQQIAKSDKTRVAKILEHRPILKQFLDLQEVKNNLASATDDLKNIHHLLLSLQEGHDGLEEKLKSALWLREWIKPREKVSNLYDYTQEVIQEFKTKVDKLMTTTEMIANIPTYTVWVLLERCDEKLEKLLKSYRVKLIDNKDYISFLKDLYSTLEKEDPTSDVSLRATASRSKENIIADLEKLKTSLDELDKKLFRQRRLVLLIKDHAWAGAAAKDSFLKKTDKDVKGYIGDLRQHAQELIVSFQREQAGN